jgi:LAO/AO transport system ATPase
MLDALLDRFRHHDRQALSRLLSMAARGEQLSAILASLPAPACPPRVIAVTGSAGVGKSTLIGKLIEFLRRRNLTVAVLACDPQSPLSGGALLGDRFRMPAQPDDGVFIRSLATAGGHGAVASHLDALLRVLQGFGFDVILIETVGAGQGDTAVQALADAVLVLVQPETGDDLQWEKAGLLEVADVVAVHKADLPGAEHTEAQAHAMLGLSAANVPVLRVSSKTGEGMEQLWNSLAALPLRRQISIAEDADLLQLAQDALACRFATARQASDPSLTGLLADWRQGKLVEGDAARQLIQLLAKD